MKYKRLFIPGVTYFFTVVTHQRRPILNNDHAIKILKQALQTVRANHPFDIDAIVVLPDHVHCIWTLPENDIHYAKRWRLIKTWFTKHCDPALRVAMDASRKKRNQQAIWQHRYWEHMIRDETDLQNHIAYIHYNRVKRGYAKSASDWPHSSFHRYVKNGLLEVNWGEGDMNISGVGKE